MSRLSEIFLEALDAPVADRERLVRELCKGDSVLEAEVLDLLRRDAEADAAFLRSPVVGTDQGSEQGAEQRAPQPPMPERIGPYAILGVLGKGGMGTVYLARQDEPIQRLVAIKTLRTATPDHAVRARFEAERQALALMDHPHVARIFDADSTPEGLAYFVMEFVPGVPIQEHVAEVGASVDEILRLFLQACAAVQHAHQKGVIHRDLKPSNVLVARVGGDATVKVIDFGIAKAMGAERGAPGLTLAGQLLGTPEYMSPEQAAGRPEDIDTRTDVHGLGVILYELLTGVRPHESAKLRAAGDEAMLRIIREEEPVRPSVRLRSLDRSAPRTPTHPDSLARSRRVAGDLDWIVMRALEKERDRRYSTVSEMADDIVRHLADEPVHAGPPSGRYRLRKFLRRHRRAVAAGLLALFGLLGGAGVAGWQAAVARAARQAADVQAAEAAWSRYIGAVSLADASILAGDMRTARTSLEQAPAELRGFEWRFLDASLDGSEALLASVDAPLASLALADGKRQLVTGDIRGVVRCYDVASGALTFEERHHAKGVRSIAADPLRPRVATGSYDGTIGLLDLSTGSWQATLRGHATGVMAVAFDETGEFLASAADDHTVRLWSLEGASLRRTLTVDDSDAVAVAFARGGRELLAVTRSGLLLSWNAADGHSLARLELDSGSPTSLTIDPSTGHALVGTRSGELIVVAPDGLRRLDRIRVASVGIGRVDAPGSGLVLVSCADNIARFVDLRTREVLRELRGHEDAVTGAVFLGASGAATISADGTLRLWSANPRDALRRLRVADGGVTDVAFADEGRVLVTTAFNAPLRAWDPSRGIELQSVDVGSAGAARVAIAPGGRHAAAGLMDGSLRLWSLPGWTEPVDFRVGEGVVLGLAFSPSGERLFAASSGGTQAGSGDAVLAAWDVGSGREVLRVADLPANLHAMALDEKAQRVACGWLDGSVRIFDATTGTIDLSPSERLEGIGALAFEPGSPRLWAAGLKGELRAWDVPSGRVAFAEVGHAAGILALGWSADGARLASTSNDRTVRLWSSARTSALAAFRGLPRPGTCVAFSPDGRWLATGCMDGSVELRDSRSGNAP